MCHDDAVPDRSVIKYSKPPVRSVSLTVYFAPIDDLGVASAVELHRVFSDDYAAIQQLAPTIRPRELPETNPFENAIWPFPAVKQTNGRLNRSLIYQFDQLAIKWTFDNDAEEDNYPGYKTLSAELIDAATKFASAIDKTSDSIVQIQGAACRYENDLSGQNATNWIVGYLTGWSAREKSERSTEGNERVSLNLREESASNGLENVIFTEFEKSPGNSPILSLQSLTYNTEEDPGMDLPKAVSVLLGDAHARLIRKFQEASDAVMKEEWGVQ